MPAKFKRKRSAAPVKGRLRIGDMWNAITIIALSQNNPLKAIAEFVENSIDAHARHITILRGKERGESYLRITDDGDGIPCDKEGKPDFKYVATHICDSIKRQMKAEGVEGLQGEFGIGLLSFWTVGEELHLTSAGRDGKTYQMRMAKGEPGYEVRERRSLFSLQETELSIRPLLPGIRQLSGEKIQWYLSSELRDRIRHSGVKIKVVDRTARKEFVVEPRAYDGTLLRLDPLVSDLGEIYLELYLAPQNAGRQVNLSRRGTRVTALTSLEAFQRDPWTSGLLEGLVDAPFLALTPGTRDGVIQDEAFDVLRRSLRQVEPLLIEQIEAVRRAEDEKASRQVLKVVQRALREALLALPQEEYDWFDIQRRSRGMPQEDSKNSPVVNEGDAGTALEPITTGDHEHKSVRQQEFFEYEGNLFSVAISPASCALRVGTERSFRALTRDKARRAVERDLDIRWAIVEGGGRLSDSTGEIVTFTAPGEAGLTRLEIVARQGSISCRGEALITVTDTLLPPMGKEGKSPLKGLPGYTFEHAPGKLWRSVYRETDNLIVINSGHRDFVYAAKQRARKLRYICRLFAKELVLKNFPGAAGADLLERMVELSLYTEEQLR